MILSRIIHHLRTQNWTAVALEFVLVIAGIVIGFQITEWNQDREKREVEHTYLVRIHDELQSALGDGWLAQRAALYTDWLTTARTVADLLFSDDPDASLSPQQCETFSWLHQIYALPSPAPSLEEMIENGEFSLIRNGGLRARLARFRLHHQEVAGVTSSLIDGIVVLPLNFPELLPASLSSHPERGLFETTSCDLATLREDQVFLNAFADTYARLDYFVNLAMRSDLDATIEIHHSLDTELGLSHTTPPGNGR